MLDSASPEPCIVAFWNYTLALLLFPLHWLELLWSFIYFFLHVLHFYRLGSKPFLVFQSSSCQISILEFVLWHSYCAVHFLIFTEAFRVFYVKWNQDVVWIEAITMDWHSENPSALFVTIRSSISSYQLYLTIIYYYYYCPFNVRVSPSMGVGQLSFVVLKSIRRSNSEANASFSSVAWFYKWEPWSLHGSI